MKGCLRVFLVVILVDLESFLNGFVLQSASYCRLFSAILCSDLHQMRR